MKDEYDVIVVGGSYAGLSAAMALGRALRNTLVIDSGKPCNQQTPHSHNFITHDGQTPAQIASMARQQVTLYPTVEFVDGLVTHGKKLEEGFEVKLDNGKVFKGKRLLFTTGMKDVMPAIPGFSECWGISVLHCPYCHGYEVRNQPTAILANGEMAFELVRLIHHWTKDLVLATNGPSGLTPTQEQKIKSKGIQIIETEVDQIKQENGYVKRILLHDGKHIMVSAIYARPAMVQHCAVPLDLGCETTAQNLLTIDMFHRTSVSGVYAAGDNATMMRSVSLAVASGNFAGASINKDLIEVEF
jgi:thioredoxin reductase